MLIKFTKYFLLLLVFAAVGCAKRGAITGGLKDTIPPQLLMSVPPNYSTDFKGNTIRLSFSEYVKLKDINKQLIISPPMSRAPLISPATASRNVTIKIVDTLQPNTTYSFNFGQSIEDNNESNPYREFKYVFSTGPYIDSLSIAGRIKDAYSNVADNFVSVMLYEANDTYTDSIIYKSAPRYITNTLDSMTTFQLQNLKAGRYKLIAIKDQNNNNRFDPKSDKIGFQKDFISIPTDTLYELELFAEELQFKTFKPSQASGNRLLMGFEGKRRDFTATLRNGTEVLPTIITKLPKKDSLQIWYQPIKADSLQLDVSQGNYHNTYSVNLRAQKKDTLSFAPVQSGVLPLREKFALTSTIPIANVQNASISVQNQDSVAVAFTTDYDSFNQRIIVDFAREPLSKFKVTFMPGALTDMYGKSNDTLTYSLTTKNTSDYGNLILTLQNVRAFPVIVELTNAKGEVVAIAYPDNTNVNFEHLEPALYTLRLIYDANGNKEWDTGNFLEQRHTEEVIYFPTSINVRPNWDVIETFKLP
jgi:hypothetical protein